MPHLKSDPIQSITITDKNCLRVVINLYENLCLEITCEHDLEAITGNENVLRHISALISNTENTQEIQELERLQNKYIELYCANHPNYCAEHATSSGKEWVILNEDLSLMVIGDNLFYIIDSNSHNTIRYISELILNIGNSQEIQALEILQNNYIELYCANHPNHCAGHTTSNGKERVILHEDLSITLMLCNEFATYTTLLEIQMLYTIGHNRIPGIGGVIKEFERQYCEIHPEQCMYDNINIIEALNLYYMTNGTTNSEINSNILLNTILAFNFNPDPTAFIPSENH